MIGRLFGALAALIGYVCTATIIALLAGFAYMWQTDRLTDEKLFRMVALFHDVDLHQLAEAQRKTGETVPPEEVSLDEALRRQQVMDRNFEVKLLALRKGRQEWDVRLQELNEKIARYDRMAQDWQSKLQEGQQLSTKESLTTVVSHLEALQPLQAKEELLLWIKDGRIDDAILLMNTMSENKRGKILKNFTAPEDRARLYEIHQRIMDSGGQAADLKRALDEVNSATAED
jgi:hypothetical protein